MEAVYTPEQIAAIAADKGTSKTRLPIPRLFVLGFLAGAYIALGYLLAIRITADVPDTLGSLVNLISGAVFPLGLVLVLLAGGELLTGNMMAVSLARWSGAITTRSLLVNMVL